jgi:hypothetical protein
MITIALSIIIKIALSSIIIKITPHQPSSKLHSINHHQYCTFINHHQIALHQSPSKLHFINHHHKGADMTQLI